MAFVFLFLHCNCACLEVRAERGLPLTVETQQPASQAMRWLDGRLQKVRL